MKQTQNMKKLTIIKNYGLQGDLNFRKIDKLPDVDLEEVEIDIERGGYTLALGEHTNHAHILIADKETKVRIVKDEQGRHYLDISGGNATLLHGTFVAPTKIQETETDKHDKIVFPAGIYEQNFEEEYDAFLQQIRRVSD